MEVFHPVLDKITLNWLEVYTFDHSKGILDCITDTDGFFLFKSIKFPHQTNQIFSPPNYSSFIQLVIQITQHLSKLIPKNSPNYSRTTKFPQINQQIFTSDTALLFLFRSSNKVPSYFVGFAQNFKCVKWTAQCSLLTTSKVKFK